MFSSTGIAPVIGKKILEEQRPPLQLTPEATNLTAATKLNRPDLTEVERLIGTPYTDEDLFETFRGGGSFSKHLLLLYSFVVGTNARVIADIGIGSTTRALLAAAQHTRGRVYSCDYDKRRYSRLLAIYEKSKRWRLSLTRSDTFIDSLPAGLDFVSHDGAHDAITVRDDLNRIIPKMKQFGLVTIHDTQHAEFRDELVPVINEMREKYPITTVTLPYNCGLTIIRVEESDYGKIVPSGLTKGNRVVTEPAPWPT